jgi:hypothetical protein
MAGRRPRSGTGSAGQGPASGTRRAWSSTARPGGPGPFGPPGDPAGPDILERAPGRWSVSRLPGPPRWLLAAIAVLVLAGGGVALVTGTGGPGAGHGRVGGSDPGSPPICVGLHVQAWHPATQFGIRHRCYPGLA